MANGYDHDHHKIQHHQKPVFLPILCRLSMKDINLNNHYKIKPKPSENNEPSSPKVSCMGQVKRNNRVNAFPNTTTTTTIATANHHKKHIKVQKLFSNNTLLPNTTTRSGSRSCRTSRDQMIMRSTSRVHDSRKLIKASRNDICHKINVDHDQDCHVKMELNISQMDPPLPVVKRVVASPGSGRDEVNIWKRRFNGEGLKSLQIEQIHLPNTKFRPPTTV